MAMSPISNSSLPKINSQMPQKYQTEDHLQKYPHFPQVQQNQLLPSLQQQLMQQSFAPYQTALYHYPIPQESIGYMAPYPSTMTNSVKHITSSSTTSNLPLFQAFNRLPVDHFPVQHQQQLRQISPVSPLTNNQYGKPIFQLPSQTSTINDMDKIEISDATLSKAIEAAEAFVAKEVGHIPRKNKSRSLNPKTDASYVCHLCGKMFNRPYNLKSHQKTHSTEKPYPCKFCSKSFARSHDRKRHEKLHEGEKKFKCGGILKDGTTPWGCNRRFARADALGRHFRTETGWSCIKPLMTEAKDLETRQGLIASSESDYANLEIHRLLENKTQIRNGMK